MEILRVGVQPEVYVRLACARASVNDSVTVVEAAKNGPAQVEFYPLPNQTAWTGEGLPPVGTVCEFIGTTAGLKEWKECRVVGHDGHYAVINYKNNYSGHLPGSFRPIRTPEQIAREERRDGISNMYKDAKEIGEIDGVPTLVQALHALWKAGYRKQVTE